MVALFAQISVTLPTCIALAILFNAQITPVISQPYPLALVRYQSGVIPLLSSLI